MSILAQYDRIIGLAPPLVLTSFNTLDLGSSICLSLFLSIAWAGQRKGEKNGGANRKSSRFSNEIIKTALNLPRILRTIIF